MCVRACVRRPVWRWWGVWLCACVRASTCVVVLLVCVGGGVRASAQESGDMLVLWIVPKIPPVSRDSTKRPPPFEGRRIYTVSHRNSLQYKIKF